MLFINRDNRFELNLVRYEFPTHNNNETDANWLLVSISVDHPKGSWSSTDPSLLTWEVERLVDWLRSVANETAEGDKLSFLEPNLRFEIVDGSPKKIRAYFEWESRPNWAPSDGAGMDDLWVEFELKFSDLLAAADSLEHDLQKFQRREFLHHKAR